MNESMVLENWKTYLANRPKVDLTKCTPNQRLLTKNGKIVTYIGPSGIPSFPHNIQFDDYSRGTRTNEGWVFEKRPLPMDDDIIYIMDEYKEFIDTINPNSKNTFHFCLDVFNNDDKWRAANDHFEYIGDTVGSRIWQFIGTLSEFKTELNKFNLTITGGYRSNPNWNSGEWILISLQLN